MTEMVLSQLAALKTMPIGDLKQKWRDLFEREPPVFNRRYIESRLAYRIQELAYGGLPAETVARLEALGEQLSKARRAGKKPTDDRRPISGTRLIREWNGVEHCVTVRDHDFEYMGRPYKSLSAVARTIARQPLERLGLLRPAQPGRPMMPRLKQQQRMDNAASSRTVLKKRCAVYTRKSSEEGLDMEFNSLDAQREACEAYVVSQRAEGWVLAPDRYDDGGFSGGTLDRPALQRMIADIEANLIDIVVCYKIDRLSRSLMDFARLVEVFERKAVTFVSVTQSFNTTTSMGRLTLNMLLSFAQFEREVIGERIRDKVAASRRKGMWMGGWAPLGYEVRDRKLVINQSEAATVRRIFDRFTKGTSVTEIAKDLASTNFRNRYGQSLDKGRIYKLLNNRVYVGDAVHKGTAYPGEHAPIINKAVWDKTQSILAENGRKRAGITRAQTPALLKGLLFDATGRAMSPTHTRKRQRLYRYYVSQSAIRGTETEGDPNENGDTVIRRVPAAEIERAVLDQLRVLIRSPEIVVATWRVARKEIAGLTEAEVRETIQTFDPLWDELFHVEQARMVRLLVQRVRIDATGIEITLHPEGPTKLLADIGGAQREAA